MVSAKDREKLSKFVEVTAKKRSFFRSVSVSSHFLLQSPEQGHRGAFRRKWRLTDTDLCPCGETQTMSHIVESNGGLSRLHSADEVAVSWLISYGS